MIKQAKDAYQWCVTYTDGTTTDEYSEDRPDGRGWAEREDKPVQAVTLIRDGVEVQSLPIPEDAEPVFFRRRVIIFSPTDESSKQRTQAHCIGWTRGDEAVYLFVTDDGTTLLSSDLQAI